MVKKQVKIKIMPSTAVLQTVKILTGIGKIINMLIQSWYKRNLWMNSRKNRDDL